MSGVKQFQLSGLRRKMNNFDLRLKRMNNRNEIFNSKKIKLLVNQTFHMLLATTPL